MYMTTCTKCNKIFKTLENLENHKNKFPNCINKCNICLKKFSSKQMLTKHENIICEQKYGCDTCNIIYSTKYYLDKHLCNPSLKEKTSNNITDILQNIINDKHVNINIYNNNNNNNEIKHEVKNEVNNNSKNEINNNSKNITNKVKVNYLDTKPSGFKYNYKITKNLMNMIPKYLKMSDYDEELADQYMYSEAKFMKEQNDEIIRKYDKEPLQVEGMKLLFEEIQKEPKNRNVIIKKSKSGKCQVYDSEWGNGWNEEKQKKIITKICNKVCDTLFDIDTSVNHFIRLVLGSQPKRCTELRKHVHNEVMKASIKIKNEIKEIK